MEKLIASIRSMITISDKEIGHFLSLCSVTAFNKKEYLSQAGQKSNRVFFINKGLVRVLLVDKSGAEHSCFFSSENQYIAEYSSFLTKSEAIYSLQALEDTEVIILPRKAIDWAYEHMQEGEKLGRLIAEYYLLLFDDRMANMYLKSPKERYDDITKIFPEIHNRVPQHMIASYLGISSVHLSRLKKSS